MKSNKSKSKKLQEAIQDLEDPIQKELEDRFGPVVNVFKTDEELRKFYKELAEKRGEIWKHG